MSSEQSFQETFESQKKSLAESWDAEYEDETTERVCKRVLLKNTVRLAQHAVLEKSKASEK